MQRIADTGLIVAALDRLDRHHTWAAQQLEEFAPFHTCEAVLVEVSYLLDDPLPGLRLVLRGDLLLNFSLDAHKARVLELLEKYSRMDLADGCLVKMSEMVDRCQIWTVDRSDFTIYRRHGRQTIPCAFPP